MKLLIASDLHGSEYYCKKLMEIFEREKPDRLLLLGDILYHGARNNLPKDYNPKKVIEMLNSIKECILCVRGNCDSEVDQMVLDFPISSDYALIVDGKVSIFATHGHIFNQDNLPPLKKGDILLNGHFHVPKCVECEGYTYMNPGSITLPKEDSWHGYMTVENGVFTWKDVEGQEKNKWIYK